MDVLARNTRPSVRDQNTNPCVRRLRCSVWDDHDYGLNDIGKNYPFKEESKQIFLDFWGVSEDSDVALGLRSTAVIAGDPLASDCGCCSSAARNFRDDLLPAVDPELHRNDYRPNPDPSVTLLGDAQWAWLEQQLLQPAEVRVIATSTQFGVAYNGYEAWANFPAEQERLVALIRETQAEGVVFISGDVHYGELSRLQPEAMYPLYDLTSSGITQTWPEFEPNANRIGEAESTNNFGWLAVVGRPIHPRSRLASTRSTARHPSRTPFACQSYDFGTNSPAFRGDDHGYLFLVRTKGRSAFNHPLFLHRIEARKKSKTIPTAPSPRTTDHRQRRRRERRRTKEHAQVIGVA